MSAFVVIELTRSQHMALLDVLLEHSRGDGTQYFVDCSSAEGVTTSTGDLLVAVMNGVILGESTGFAAKPGVGRPPSPPAR